MLLRAKLRKIINFKVAFSTLLLQTTQLLCQLFFWTLLAIGLWDLNSPITETTGS